MAGAAVWAAAVRVVFGFAGLGIGYAVSSSLLASLEAEMTPGMWATLTATDTFGTIGGLLTALLTLGLGVLFAYGADLVRVETHKHIGRSQGRRSAAS